MGATRFFVDSLWLCYNGVINNLKERQSAMNDLTEIALNALESDKYAETNDDATNTNDDADENDTSNAGDEGDDNTNDDGDTTETDNTDETDGEDSDGKTDGDESDDEDSDESETDDKKDKKDSDEMTDEEFEELAKKRGYSKNKSDDNERKKDGEEKQRNDAINAIPKPKELDADTWGAMPPLNRFIYSKLPFITVHGKEGDIKIKTPEQLPDNFEFASDKARAKYVNDIQAQETTAQNMANVIQRQAYERQAATQRQAQARRIIDEVSALQDSGDLPKPKAQPNTPEFDNDPAVKTINKVLNYQITRSQQGVNLSVRDALLLYRAEHPEDFKKPEDTKAKGDEERKKIAKKVAGNTKSTTQTAADESAGNKRKYYRPGMSTQDVAELAMRDLD